VTFFWSVGDFSFEKDTIRHIFTGQYYGLQLDMSLHSNTSSWYRANQSFLLHLNATCLAV